MEFKDFYLLIQMINGKIPENAKVEIDFTEVKRYINKDVPQYVSSFTYDKENNVLKVHFKSEEDKNYNLVMNTRFDLSRIRR